MHRDTGCVFTEDGQKPNHLLFPYGGKLCEKTVNGIPRLYVIKECLHSHARAGKTRSAMHHLRIDCYNGFHTTSLPKRSGSVAAKHEKFTIYRQLGHSR
jgi:hypothetical protein